MKQAPTDIQVGDIIKYSRSFLRSIGYVAGDMGFARAKVLIVGDEFATVKWLDDEGLTSRVRLTNIVQDGKIELA